MPIVLLSGTLYSYKEQKYLLLVKEQDPVGFFLLVTGYTDFLSDFAYFLKDPLVYNG